MSIIEKTKEGFWFSEDGEWVPDGWTNSPLNEVVSDFIDYRGKTPQKTMSGIPLITAKVVKDGRVFQTKEYIAEDDYDAWMRRGIPRQGDVILTTEAPLGEVAFIPDGKIALAQRIITLRGKEGRLDNRYLKYSLQSPMMQYRLVARESGSTVSGIKSSELKITDLLHPEDFNEQQSIAAVLGSLDDKIELLREQNETLEALAQTLFKRWFIDFNFPDENGNPYKDNGGKMIPSELGEIPEGWKVDCVSSHVDTISETFPLKEREEVIFLNTGDIQNGKFLHASYTPAKELPGQAKKSIKRGDILFSEIRPENHRHAYVSFDSPDYVVSTKLMVLRKTSGLDSVFTYFFMRQKSSIDHLQMMADSRSGTFPQITYSTLNTLLLATPKDLGVAKLFTELILKPFFEKQQTNTQQIQTLTQLRDTLLPKLMKGEIRIPVES